MSFLAKIITLINVVTNVIGQYVFGAIMSLPGWLSNTIISAVVGVLLLVIFKYTSNQKAIGKVRDSIKANMLALKLFKDDLVVTLQSLGKVFKGAFLLLFHAIVPMLIMMIPVILLLSQMGMWYQSQALQPGEETLVVMQLNGAIESPLPNVSIESAPAIVTMGPIKVLSKRQIYWKISAGKIGNSEIIFDIDGDKVAKSIAVGDGVIRLSHKRPAQKWNDILLYPGEKPFAEESKVSSISIDYPDKSAKMIGIAPWIIHFFVASMVFALLFKPFLKVKI